MVRLLYVSIVIGMAMTSCAMPPPVPDEVVTEKYADTPSDEIYQNLNAAYASASREGMDFFAPDQFSKGQAALFKANYLRRTKAADIHVLKQLYIAEKQLRVCRQVKIQAEKQLPEILSALNALRQKSVTRSYASEFDRLVYQASHLLRNIEGFVMGEPAGPQKDLEKEKADLLRKLQELEIKTVKFNALNESKVIFKEVQSLGGSRLAPKTFKKAEQALQRANAVIERNVNDKDAVAEAAKKYEFAVFHTLQVTRAAAKLDSLSGSEYETYILELENNLQTIAEAFGYRDIRNHTLHEQIQLLAGLGRRLMIQKANLEQVSGVSGEDFDLDINKLKEQHKSALHKIRDLSDQLAQLQTRQSSATVAVTEETKQLKRKAAQLEEQVSQLLLQYNNIKAQRDSLQNKLNAVVTKNSKKN